MSVSHDGTIKRTTRGKPRRDHVVRQRVTCRAEISDGTVYRHFLKWKDLETLHGYLYVGNVRDDQEILIFREERTRV